MRNLVKIENNKIYALLIGVGNYEQIDSQNLATYKNDVSLFKEALESGLRIPEDNIRLCIGENNNGFVTSATLAYAIADFEKGLGVDDSFIMYFSGHGKDRNIILSNGLIILQSLIDYIDKIHAKNKLVIMDCCYSGNFKGMGARQMRFDDLMSDFAGRGIAVMASSAADEQSRLNVDRNASVFTVAISDSIMSNRYHSKGYLSLNGIYEGMMNEIGDWNRKHLDKQQHPIFRSSIGGTVYFKVDEYTTYEPQKIQYDRQEYKVVHVKPLSTLEIKRLAAFIITNGKANSGLLSGITQEVVRDIKNAEVYSSEHCRERFGSSPAKAIWCYFGSDESDILNGLHYAYSIWADDDETIRKYYRSNKSSEIIRGICLFHNTSYDMLRDMQNPTKTREEFIEDNRRLLTLIVSLSERFIYDLQEVNNHSLSMEELYARYDEWIQDVKNRYIELSDTDISPDNLKEWSDGIMDLAGWVVDMAVILENSNSNCFSDRELWLIKNRISHYYESIEKIKKTECMSLRDNT